MNSGILTGGVCVEAENAYTPKTATTASIRRVLFSVATTDRRGQRGFWKCEVEGDDAHLDYCKENATPGRGVRIEYELACRPFEKRGVHVGESRFLRVLKIEFSEVKKEHAA